MSVGLAKRFEVLKRDNFTCTYCGARPPGVVLEVDHRIARSKGGGDEIANLVTSCFDCNRGKRTKDVPNNQVVAVAPIPTQIDQLAGYFFIAKNEHLWFGRILHTVGEYAVVETWDALVGTPVCAYMIPLATIASQNWELHDDHDWMIHRLNTTLRRREQERDRASGAVRIPKVVSASDLPPG